MQSCGQGTSSRLGCNCLWCLSTPTYTVFSRPARVADRVRDHPTATKRGRAELPLGTISGFRLPPLGRNPRHGPERSAGLASHWPNHVVVDSQNAEGTSVARMASAARLSRIEQCREHSIVSAAHADDLDESPPIPGLAKRRFTNAAPESFFCRHVYLSWDRSLSTPVMNSSTPPSKGPC